MNNEMFKIRVYNKEKSFQIVEQPENIREGLVGIYNDIEIRKCSYPEFQECRDTLFIRGDTPTKNDVKVYCGIELDTVLNALKYLCEDKQYKFIKVGDTYIGEI